MGVEGRHTLRTGPRVAVGAKHAMVQFAARRSGATKVRARPGSATAWRPAVGRWGREYGWIGWFCRPFCRAEHPIPLHWPSCEYTSGPAGDDGGAKDCKNRKRKQGLSSVCAHRIVGEHAVADCCRGHRTGSGAGTCPNRSPVRPDAESRGGTHAVIAYRAESLVFPFMHDTTAEPVPPQVPDTSESCAALLTPSLAPQPS